MGSNIKKRGNTYKGLTEAYYQFICDKGPYDFFITLTFGKKMGVPILNQHIKVLLDRYNQLLFTRAYKKHNKYVEGFAFLEKHQSEVARNEYHFHLLITCKEKFAQHSLHQHEDIFQKAAYRVKDEKGRRIFNGNCIKIVPVRDEGAIGYCLKQIYDNTLHRIKFIGMSGLPDNLEDE